MQLECSLGIDIGTIGCISEYKIDVVNLLAIEIDLLLLVLLQNRVEAKVFSIK